MNSKVHPILYAFLFPSGAAATGQYYADYANELCKNTPDHWGAKFSSITLCCQTALSWVRLNICEANSAGETPTGTSEWYIDWSLEKCVQDCPVSQNSDCGGLASPWQTLYATEEACCENTFPGEYKGDCLKPTSAPSVSDSDKPSEVPSESPSSKPSVSSDKPSVVPTLSLMPSKAGQYYPDSQNDRCLQEEPCNTGVLPCLPGHSWGPTYLSIQECCQKAVGWVRPEICVANSGGQAFSGTNEWYMDWSLEKCVQDCNDSQNSDCGGFSQSWQTLFATEEVCCDASVTGAWRGNCLDASSLPPSASPSDVPSIKPSSSTPPSLSPSTSTTVYESRTDLTQECPAGLGLAENECQTAADELGLSYWKYSVSNWDGNQVPVPCGCHLWHTSANGVKLNYNTGSQCGTSTYVRGMICRKVPSISPSLSQQPSTSPSLSPSESGTYLSVCGASGKTTACSANAPAATNTAEDLPVRCCKDSTVDLSSSGWTRGNGNWTPTSSTCTNVWARSLDADGNCQTALNFWEARAMCTDLGGRLCTSEELLADCTRGAGCGFDEFMVWSSTEVVSTATPSDAPSSKPSSVPSISPSLSQQPSTPPSLSPSESGTYLLACGASSYSTACAGNTAATNTAEEHPVRCCKDSTVDLSSSGWTRGSTYWTPTSSTCTDVWARSDDADGNCQSALNFWEARAMCTDLGGRLCTSEELLADCTRGAGCGGDNAMVWSSTEVP
jgi:hypothetical protein